MRSRFLVALIALTASLSAAVHAPEPYEFTISQNDYRFCTIFPIDSRDTYPGQVKKSRIRPWTSYDLSDADGWQARAQYKWTNTSWYYGQSMMEMWISDTDGYTFALIDGQMLTTAPARYAVMTYEEGGEEQKVAVITLNDSRDAFTFYFPEDETRRIAEMRRVILPDVRDHWVVRVYHPERIDDRIVRLFAAWAIDNQSTFLLDDVDIPPNPAPKMKPSPGPAQTPSHSTTSRPTATGYGTTQRR